jgi:DNA modification methylase
VSDVRTGDCREIMRAMNAGSVDAIVTDPPYGIGFMGKEWDHGVPGVEFWAEALRVAKAGSYLVAFGGTRTFHRQVCAIEDAEWEIADCLSWLYGSGFPKHVSKLKPAWEPITLARKPAKIATPLNIGECRIAASEEDVAMQRKRTGGEMGAETVNEIYEKGRKRQPAGRDGGRWPANVVIDEEAGTALDEQSGTLTSGANPTRRSAPKFRTIFGGFLGQKECEAARGADEGGASRFFYCAKPTRRERDAGLEGTVRAPGGAHRHGTGSIGSKEGRDRPVHNHHPTVKPVSLMRWLVRLVTPRNGLVLDPFCGSGTTGCAAIAEGFRFIGCELDAEYTGIARARIAATQPSLWAEVPA